MKCCESHEIINAGYYLALLNVPKMGQVFVKRLVSQYPTIDSLRGANHQELQGILGLEIFSSLKKQMEVNLYESVSSYITLARQWSKNDIGLIPLGSDNYPVELENISDPPSVIFCRGNLKIISNPSLVAVVGTRNSSNLGKVIAEQLGSELSNLGCVVVSGLAQGIDTCAHMGSVKAAAPAIAILGTEPNTVTPTANKSLANQIVDLDGALLTEVHPGQETNRYKFIQRNRIQAGISKFLFVVEMGIAGGTMHTVRFAKKYRKPIFVPRPIYEAQTFESNAGIKALVDSGDAQAFGLRDLPDIINGSYPISQRHVSSGDQLSLM